MHNYFEREITALERELYLLKTAAQRSSGTVETLSRTLQLNLPLSMNAAQTTCSGDIYYVVNCDSDSIVNATLDWYYENVADAWKSYRPTRSATLDRFMLSDGSLLLRVVVYGSDWSSDASDDLSKLKNGQSVSIPVKLTVQCTDNFTLETYP